MLLTDVRRTIERRGLIERGMCVLAACSGGPDSAAMLAALAQLSGELGFALLAASVDHQLRADSASDVATARAQASSLGVSFEALRVELPAGPSLQAQARQARYAVLLEAASRLGAQRIAVGHTQEDQAETVLMRLLRGSGLSGLSAIEPARSDGVIRPLIDCSRAAAHAFAAAHFAEIAVDPSNHDPRFERVRVRRRLLPVLLEEDPKLAAHLADLADDARDAEFALRQRASEVLERCRQGTESIGVSTLSGEPSAIRRGVLRLWAEQATGAIMGRAHLVQLEHALLHGGEVWLPGGYAARRRTDTLSLAPARTGRLS